MLKVYLFLILTSVGMGAIFYFLAKIIKAVIVTERKKSIAKRFMDNIGQIKVTVEGSPEVKMKVIDFSQSGVGLFAESFGEIAIKDEVILCFRHETRDELIMSLPAKFVYLQPSENGQKAGVRFRSLLASHLLDRLILACQGRFITQEEVTSTAA